MQEIFGVLTDRLHKSAFKLHVDILHSMVVLVETGQIVAPLGEPGKDNRQFVREFVAGLLASSFPHLTPCVCPRPCFVCALSRARLFALCVPESLLAALGHALAVHCRRCCCASCVRAGIHGFVVGLFDATKDETSYRAHMRDFLIELKEFSAEDNAELFMDDLAAAASRAAELELERRRGVPGLLTMDDLEDL